MYLYRAIDSVGDTVEFWFSEQRDLPRPSGSSEKRWHVMAVPTPSSSMVTRPTRRLSFPVTSQIACRSRSRRRLKPIRICKSKYLNNRIEQDHRRIKRRIRSMLGFKSPASAAIILNGIEMVHMMRKQQARFAFNPNPSLAEQFQRCCHVV
ncbi:DDE-type integrase/transposase/recombinase [Mesorhizobium sp.]|uniref:DDE-type integrase/transposase/recombinase n=1 Tax=Mesorhizobium sp. TaxID=1871066 RepID=UPI0025B98F0E|nr:DDE-type integrase/transposase/recombinase [Mesorhizobium sp.]